MARPIPKAIATAVTLTVAAAALMAFTRGDDSKHSVPSAATVPSVSGTTTPQVNGHPATSKHKPKATSTPTAAERAASTTTSTSKPSASTPSPQGSAPKPTSPSPSPSPSPTNTGLLAALFDALHPHH